jgi:hypothetical protein
MLGEGAVGHPTGVCEFPIYPVLVRHLFLLNQGSAVGTDERK